MLLPRPDAEALNAARTMRQDFPDWRPAIAQALFEHYQPYGEAIAAGEEAAPDPPLDLQGPSDVWAHTTIDYIQVAPLEGLLTVEFGLRVAWDEEHTLGACLRGGTLVGLNGSVLAP